MPHLVNRVYLWLRFLTEAERSLRVRIYCARVCVFVLCLYRLFRIALSYRPSSSPLRICISASRKSAALRSPTSQTAISSEMTFNKRQQQSPYTAIIKIPRFYFYIFVDESSWRKNINIYFSCAEKKDTTFIYLRSSPCARMCVFARKLIFYLFFFFFTTERCYSATYASGNFIPATPRARRRFLVAARRKISLGHSLSLGSEREREKLFLRSQI